MNTYWHVNDLTRFKKIMIHQIAGDLKYLCCHSCQSAILGYQVISEPDQIYISSDRVKLENELEERDDDQQYDQEEMQY